MMDATLERLDRTTTRGTVLLLLIPLGTGPEKNKNTTCPMEGDERLSSPNLFLFFPIRVCVFEEKILYSNTGGH